MDRSVERLREGLGRSRTKQKDRLQEVRQMEQRFGALVGHHREQLVAVAFAGQEWNQKNWKEGFLEGGQRERERHTQQMGRQQERERQEPMQFLELEGLP